ncbi:MAG: prolipoprotein diacylglyceryl transferase [Myxococcales bacterium]|jgi:phosphatidylglycerol:prolipoprotein diacylglycerol transferase
MHPVLFTIPTPWGEQPIYSYGLMLGLSLVLGWQLVARVAARVDGLDEDEVGNAYFVAAVCGLLGARLLYVLLHPELVEQTGQRWYDFASGGGSAYGGFLGGLLGAAIYCRIKRLPLGALADASAPAVAVGTVLTRTGCYLYGCDFGTRLSDAAPSALRALGTFPAGSPAFHHHVDRFALAADASGSLPVHPTQLYEALFGLALLALSVYLLRRRRFRGQVMLAVAMAYGAFRFVVEYVRANPEAAGAFGFSSAQLLSVPVIALCALAYSHLSAEAHRMGPATR